MISDERRAELLRLTEAVSAAGFSDTEARDAINGYLEAAMFTATDDAGESLDGLGYSWSAEAQGQAFDDVMAFLAANAEDCREFLLTTGLSALQIGIDFLLTRNGEGAGFWDRGAGAVGDRLTAASKPYGSITVILAETGELDFM